MKPACVRDLFDLRSDRFLLNRLGTFPVACCVFATINPTSVIPACFKRESRRVRTWTPDKKIRGDKNQDRSHDRLPIPRCLQREFFNPKRFLPTVRRRINFAEPCINSTIRCAVQSDLTTPLVEITARFQCCRRSIGPAGCGTLCALVIAEFSRCTYNSFSSTLQQKAPRETHEKK